MGAESIMWFITPVNDIHSQAALKREGGPPCLALNAGLHFHCVNNGHKNTVSRTLIMYAGIHIYTVRLTQTREGKFTKSVAFVIDCGTLFSRRRSWAREPCFTHR